jgi:hypothetical protein
MDFHAFMLLMLKPGLQSSDRLLKYDLAAKGYKGEQDN